MESTDDSSTLDISQLSGTYWWGVPTLFRCELESDPSKADIALVGVPHSSGNGTTERDQHLGPRAVRDQSMGYRRFNSFEQISLIADRLAKTEQSSPENTIAKSQLLS